MLLNADYHTPQILTGYARAAAKDLPVNQFRLRQWLPDRDIDDLTFRFNRGGDSLISAATYRAFDAESPISARAGVTRVSGELPPISRKILLTEYDRLRTRANPDAGISAAILGDTERLVKQISARLELARADAIFNGSVTIAENGVKASVTFGRSSSMSVATLTSWVNTGSADPLTDLLTWRQAYVDLNGQEPGVFLTSTRVRGLLLQNQAIRALLSNGSVTPTIVTLADLTNILQAFGLPPIEVYDARYANASGTPTRVTPETAGVFLPPAVNETSPDGTDLGATFFGTTAESLDSTYGLAAGSEAGIVAGSYRSEDPISLWTKAAAIALPVAATPNLAMRCTVIL